MACVSKRRRSGTDRRVSPHLLLWALTGLVTSTLAPAVVLLGDRRGWRWPTLPPLVAFPAFVVLHGLIAFALVRYPGPLAWLALHVPLLAGAVLFWSPALGHGRRLGPAGRSFYLLLSGPPLDLAGVGVIVLGDLGGLAMIVGMLPLGVIAVAVTWQWITGEESAERQATEIHAARAREASG